MMDISGGNMDRNLLRIAQILGKLLISFICKFYPIFMDSCILKVES